MAQGYSSLGESMKGRIWGTKSNIMWLEAWGQWVQKFRGTWVRQNLQDSRDQNLFTPQSSWCLWCFLSYKVLWPPQQPQPSRCFGLYGVSLIKLLKPIPAARTSPSYVVSRHLCFSNISGGGVHVFADR